MTTPEDKRLPFGSGTNQGTALLLSILILSTAIFGTIYLYGQKTLDNELAGRSRLLADNIIGLLEWNAAHGGIFIRKNKGIQSDPLLRYPDIQDINGKFYTQTGHTQMFIGFSEFSKHREVFHFRLTGTSPTNPENQPDEFERRAFSAVAQGHKEFFERQPRKESHAFRYLLPLYAKKNCLVCHQTAQEGALLGGLSLTTGYQAAARAKLLHLLLIATLFGATLVLSIAILTRTIRARKQQLDTLRLELIKTQDKTLELEISDELTGLYNRRFALKQLHEECRRAVRFHRPLSCILFDLDSFNKINETHGHEIGDEVLKAVGFYLKGQCRQSDTLARYDGDKFLLILPETDKNGATTLAERYLLALGNFSVPTVSDRQIKLATSFGVETLPHSYDLRDTDQADNLLQQLEKTLTRAKQQGGNRIEVVTP